ncbi:MAG TPA: hypothetical protein VL326_00645, partial [Kofleriaceae bacterium]|nr:hypothetical protein [Kofleriaceae bacterium]
MARSAQSAGFVPAARPHVSVAGDGTLVAIREPTRIAIAELPSCSSFAELGLDSEAQEVESAWVGTPPRLIVLARHSGHSTVHLVDPFGPRTIAEVRLEAPMKLYSSVGTHALMIGSLGATILSASDRGVTLHQFPARARPVTAGAAGTMFVVALAGAIEEWDPANRMPKRRLKLPRPAVIQHVGGSDRVVWMITNENASRIEVIPLVNRGQPKGHDLPEPIASISSHPRSDLVVCVGAKSGRIFVVDLDGRSGLRMIGPEGIDRAESAALVLGRTTGVLAAQMDRPINIVTLERESEPPVEIPTEVHPSLGHAPPKHGSKPNVAPAEEPPPPEAPPAEDTKPDKPADEKPRLKRPTVEVSAPPPPPAAPPSPVAVPVRASSPVVLDRQSTDRSTPNLVESWRDSGRHNRARTAEPPPTLWDDALPAWREEAVAWARANIVAGSDPSANTATFAKIGEPPTATPFGTMIARYELAPQLQPVIALLYGAHLAGFDGVAPADIARVMGGRWDEALGRGELVLRGVTFHARQYKDISDSRVRMAPAILRALDELRPIHGQLVGTPGAVSLIGPCTIVSAGPL